MPACKDMSINAFKRVKSCMKVDIKEEDDVVTLLSNAMVNKISLCNKTLLKNVKGAGMYSVQMYTN